jgi:N-acetylated-alpha-linked acidic dipeptidase
MDMKMKFVNSTIWNVIASFPADPSSPVASEQVILGNHRDAWTFGAADPNSGTAVMLDVARSIGQLVKQGYKPQRQLIFCSWDGEEYGLLGSTAWVERYNASLVANAVAYLNIDTSVTGSEFSAAASPSLTELIRSVTTEIPFPGATGSLRDNWSGVVDVLGSGSDYTAFLHHYGIPSVNLEFDGPYGVYHSAYDSMNWMKSFGDPTFQYFVTLSQTFGLLAMRLSDYQVLSLDYETTASAMSQYLEAASALSKAYQMKLDFSSLSSSISTFADAAKAINKEIGEIP